MRCGMRRSAKDTFDVAKDWQIWGARDYDGGSPINDEPVAIATVYELPAEESDVPSGDCEDTTSALVAWARRRYGGAVVETIASFPITPRGRAISILRPKKLLVIGLNAWHARRLPGFVREDFGDLFPRQEQLPSPQELLPSPLTTLRCSMCQEDIDSESTTTLDCGHVLHSGCLRRLANHDWAERTATCTCDGVHVRCLMCREMPQVVYLRTRRRDLRAGPLVPDSTKI